MDIEKAYDMPSYYSVILNLFKAGALNMIVNTIQLFLTGRNVSVRPDDQTPQEVNLIKGAQQGGILSPRYLTEGLLILPNASGMSKLSRLQSTLIC